MICFNPIQKFCIPSRRLSYHSRNFILLILLCLSSQMTVAASMDASTLKAIVTYKFSKFTQWPEPDNSHPQHNFTLCILGKNSLSHQALKVLRGKSVKKRPLQIELFRSGILPTEALNRCKMLFVSRSEKHRIHNILQTLHKRPIFTLSDIQDFSLQGGMITLRVNDHHLGFEINTQAIEQANLILASIILELGTIVTPQVNERL